jgi:sec-independent protein translocase protein TatC
MAVPMIVLFEGAIQIARVVDKRRARREAAESYAEIGVDEPSPIDASPSALDTAPSPLDSSRRG